MPAKTGRAFIGISGYEYKPWRNRFYPPGLAARQWLRFASHRFNSIEINGTSDQREEIGSSSPNR